MKILNGAELAGFIKERQYETLRGLSGRRPRLLIIRDSDNPVILKYVELKRKYGEDVGVEVVDYYAGGGAKDAKRRIMEANEDETIDGMILQLPLLDKEKTDELTSLIAPSKDVDGLSGAGDYDSASATAVLWLLSGYDIDLASARVAVVGRGKLVGAPLMKMFLDSGVNAKMFHRGDDLEKLADFDIIITATGVPGLIKSSIVGAGAVVVDAGTASEKGILMGDVSEEVRERRDLRAITPKVGGVGPLTVTCLFEHVIDSYMKKHD